jgi:hypothetical protein
LRHVEHAPSTLYQGEGTGWSAVNTGEIVERRKETHARGQPVQVDEAFYKRNAGTENRPVHDELVCGPSRLARGRLFEEIAADAFRPLRNQPFRRFVREPG